MKRAPAPTWKPTRCHGCGAPHPSLSRNGKLGPWLCAPCDRRAA